MPPTYRIPPARIGLRGGREAILASDSGEGGKDHLQGLQGLAGTAQNATALVDGIPPPGAALCG